MSKFDVVMDQFLKEIAFVENLFNVSEELFFDLNISKVKIFYFRGIKGNLLYVKINPHKQGQTTGLNSYSTA